MNLSTVILAAGKGTRMKSDKIKVLHEVMGKSMIKHVIDLTYRLNANQTVVVVGNDSERVKSELSGERVVFAEQTEQLGTGHAVMMARDFIADSDVFLVLTGDAPLFRYESISELIDKHVRENNDLTVLTAKVKNPTGYGRMKFDSEGNLSGIVEEKDATDSEKRIDEINSGVMLFSSKMFLKHMDSMGVQNSQGEYYLTDMIGIFSGNGLKLGTHIIFDEEEILGINNRLQLADAGRIMRRRINEMHMTNGVTITDPSNTYIDEGVEIANDVIIEPGSHLKGKTVIGKGCIIGPAANITDTEIGENTKILSSTLAESKVGSNTSVGPYAYLRPGSNVGSGCKIGDFVEVKNSVIGDGTKVSHLAYIGDSDLGRNINVGCGVIFVNYDGKKKHRSTIEDNVFIGCNSNIVSPVVIRENAYVAAGTTVTREVPGKALAIGRVRQENKENWVE